MSDLLVLLSEHSEALTVVFAGVVTISTVVYAVLTGILVAETRKMREVQTEPRVHITLESFESAVHIMRLCVQNIGLGPASDLNFKPSVVAGGEAAQRLLDEFTQSNFFNTGVRHFGPGQKIYSMFTQTTEDHEGKAKAVLSFKLSYRSATGKKYSEEIIVDMSEIKGRYTLGKPNMYSIALSLEKMQIDIQHVVSGFKRIKADTYSDEDRKRERQERER